MLISSFLLWWFLSLLIKRHVINICLFTLVLLVPKPQSFCSASKFTLSNIRMFAMQNKHHIGASFSTQQTAVLSGVRLPFIWKSVTPLNRPPFFIVLALFYTEHGVIVYVCNVLFYHQSARDVIQPFAEYVVWPTHAINPLLDVTGFRLSGELSSVQMGL